MAFPFVFPGAYSIPQTLTTAAYGWIHSPNPEVNIGSPSAPSVIDQGNANGTTLGYLQSINHNPLDTGDNLPHPGQPERGIYRPGGASRPGGRRSPASGMTPPSRSTCIAASAFGLQPARRLANIRPARRLPAGTLAAGDDGPVPTTRNPQPYNDGFGSTQRLLPAERRQPASPLVASIAGKTT